MDETFREAVPGDNPSGENLRYSPIYGEIRAGVRRARGEVLPDPDGADFRSKSVMWRFVIGACRDLLRRRSKDLMLAAWLTEAQLAVDGLPGLRDGLDILRALVESFWETLYPEMEDGDAEARLRIFEWIDTHLAQAITAKTDDPDFFATEASYRRRLPELIDCRDSLAALDHACWEKAHTQRTFHNLETVILGAAQDAMRRLSSVIEQQSPAAASALKSGFRDWITRDRLEKLLRDTALSLALGEDDERLHANAPEPGAAPVMSVPPPAPSMAPPDLPEIRDRDTGLKRTWKHILPPAPKVVFTLTAPEAVAVKVPFELFIWAHEPRERAKILARAREELGGNVLERAKGPVKIAVGTVLSVRLTIPGAEIAEPEDTMAWEGESTCVSFVITLPALGEGGKSPGVAHIYADGVQVAKISFVLSAAGAAEITATHFRKAFASYASPDRDAVLGRIQGIQKIAPEMDIFLDVLSLRSGQNWEQELWRVIPESDIFYLFWSSNARQSQWVEKEWRCALRERGLEFIDPIPLESPKESPPPPELSSLHFNDWELAFQRGKA